MCEVPCISSQGLRMMEAFRLDGKFLDPWKREGTKLITIDAYYDPYIISGDFFKNSA